MNLRPLLPLLLAASILLAGNGVQGTLIAVRGAQEGFSTGLIGFIGTAYFCGFLLACVVISRFLNAVGHIRTFAALAAIAAAGTLMLVLIINGPAWAAIRFVMGFCFAGLFTTIESWLNTSVDNAARGRLLSVYRIIDIVAVTSAQFMLPVFGTGGFTIFAVITIMVALSLVPVSLGDRSSPAPPSDIRFDLAGIWHLSPLAFIGCLAIGATNSAFRLIGPVYAQDIGLSITSVATFMSAGILGGAVLQYPLGYWSDKHDRRIVLMATSGGAVFAGLFLVFFAGTSEAANYAGIFMFGAFALPLYSLSIAHANDHADASQYVMVSAGLMFCFSIGAIIGPFLSSFFVEIYGPAALFTYTSAIHLLLILITLWRMRVRGPVPAARRGAFTMLMRTSPVLARLARGNPAVKSDGNRQSTNTGDAAKDLSA